MADLYTLVSPTSVSGSGWDNSENAIDGNESTSATTEDEISGWKSIYGSHDAINCLAVRVSASADYLRIYVRKDGESDYTQVYSGASTTKTVEFPNALSIDRVKAEVWNNPCNEPAYLYVYEIWFGDALDVPVVTTGAEPSEEDYESFTIYGTITAVDGDLDIIEKGVQYRKTADPDWITESRTTGLLDWHDVAWFVFAITGLTHATEYTYRAFAVSAAGTGYGDEVTFTTDSVAPIMAIYNCTNVTRPHLLPMEKFWIQAVLILPLRDSVMLK